jgi:hypothetical protein
VAKCHSGHQVPAISLHDHRTSHCESELQGLLTGLGFDMMSEHVKAASLTGNLELEHAWCRLNNEASFVGIVLNKQSRKYPNPIRRRLPKFAFEKSVEIRQFPLILRRAVQTAFANEILEDF